jgi:hypothetical protein
MSGNLFIPKPCSENWNQMTPAEKGRHCAVCSKVVTDFTQMKTEEIISTLQTSTDEVCGRIDLQQLTPVNTTQKIYFWMKAQFLPKIGYAALAFLGLASILKRSVYAQTDNHLHIAGGLKYQLQAKDEKQINVVVVDETNRPVPNAEVNIFAGDLLLQTLNTDNQGSLQTKIEMQESGYANLRLEIHATHFLSKTLDNIRITKNGQTIRVKLDENVILMGKISILEPIELVPATMDSVKNKESLEQEKEEIDNLPINQVEPVYPSDEENQPVLADPNHQPDFIAFPNPTWGEFVLETQQELYFDVKVMNELGVLVLAVNNQHKRCSLSLAGQPAGTYYAVLFVGDKAVETHKIVLVK